MPYTGLDAYIADTQFRSRNPLFKTSETYHTEKETPCVSPLKQAQKQNISKQPANIECAKMKNKIFQKRVILQARYIFPIP